MVAVALEPKRDTQLALHNILFATDFSDASREALPWAEAIARANGAVLHLAHVVSPTFVEPFDELKFAEGLMRQFLARIAWPDTQTWLAEGAVEETLAEMVVQSKADWLVLGTHGRNGIGKFFLGSIAEEILRAAKVPTLTIGPRPMSTGTTSFEDIFCQIDSTLVGTPLEDQMEEYCHALADRYGARLTVHLGRGQDLRYIEASLLVQGTALGAASRAAREAMRVAPCPVLTLRG